MPTYVYECSLCSEVFEVDQRITEAALTDCPCGGVGTVKRVIQPPAILFKGPGFYVTDSARSSGSEKAEKKEAAPPSGDAASAEKPASPAPAPAQESAGPKPRS